LDEGDYFFNPPENLWGLLSAILAIVLFSAWTLRSGSDLTLSILVISLYSILSLVSTRFSYTRLSISEKENHLFLKFERSGISWKYLFYCLLGSAIPILLIWFIMVNSILDAPQFPQSIMIIAMVLYIGIIPILPSLSNVSKVSYLKTRMFSNYDILSGKIDLFEMQVHELDGYWYSNRNDEQLLIKIKENLIDLFHEFLEVNSS